jgi:CrcB protein
MPGNLNLKNIILVGSGGFLGSALRYILSFCIHKLTNQHWYPLGTLFVNTLGSFLSGLFFSMLSEKTALPGTLSLFLLIGLLGGFTTFSSFSHETVALIRDGQLPAAFAHVVMHITLCCGGAALGLTVSQFKTQI